MSSEPAGSPDPVVRLAEVLARVSHGVRPTPLELAEVLWLARHMRPETTEPETGTDGRETAPDVRETGATGPKAGE
ncbi:hypothetical protein, partial [Streptomyces sp. WELS2]|uniref:hypothetical protein n=1 Tax=Streptomyces sp. WELS2 TaxID=2749435 RepID=UPI0015F1200F